MHFLADDLSGGGHVLEFELAQGLLEADTVHEWLNIYLPSESASFGAADLTQDRSKELEGVEK
jgi:alpha-acetolactate decarboxylase